jgi:glycosyltransferase involved in cell wall biosynthesis
VDPSDVTAVIPTAQRPADLTDTIHSLLAQSTPPRNIIVVASKGADVERCIQENANVTLLFDAGSLTHKRNVALSHVKGKYVFFLDDDIELHHAYLSEATALLDDFPAIVGFSGKLLKDGNVTRAEAKELIHGWRHQEHWRGRLRVENRSTQFYGCNLIIRRSLLTRESFDERLPEYSLGEDYDLWVRAKRYGLTGRYDRCVAVHLRASGGRLNARKMAYSHIANHWHFLRKGVSSLPYPWNYARFVALCIKLPVFSLIQMRNAVSRAELQGYSQAIGDILAGRSCPSRISDDRNQTMARNATADQT